MASVLGFKTFNRRQYLTRVCGALRNDETALQDLRATQVTTELLHELTHDDLAVLELIRRRGCHRRRIEDRLRPAEIAVANEPVDTSEIGHAGRQLRNALEDQDRKHRYTERLFEAVRPHWLPLAKTGWGVLLSGIADRVEAAFPDEDPAATIADVVARTAPPVEPFIPSPYARLVDSIGRLLKRASVHQTKRSQVPDRWMTSLWTPSSAANSVDAAPLLAGHLLALLDHTRAVTPVIALGIEELNDQLESLINSQMAESFPCDADQPLWQLYLKLAQLLSELSEKRVRDGVWDLADYLEFSLNDISVDLIPDMHRYLQLSFLADAYPSDEHDFGVVESFLKYQASNDYRGTSLTGGELLERGYADTADGSLPGAVAHVFWHGTDFDTKWLSLRDLVSVTRRSQGPDVEDALLSVWALIWVFSETRFLDGDARRAIVDVAKCRPDGFCASLIRYVDTLGPSDRHLAKLFFATTASPTAPFSFFEPDVDLEAHCSAGLRERLSDGLWSFLTQEEQEDLVQSEICFERRKQARSGRERGYFSHVGCVLESLLKSAVNPVLQDIRQELSERADFSRLSKTLTDLHAMSTDSKKQNLGSLHLLITQRHKRLKQVPRAKHKLEQSALVERVYSREDYKVAIETLAFSYRNPASHANAERLDLRHVFAVREIIYNNNLLRELLIARRASPH